MDRDLSSLGIGDFMCKNEKNERYIDDGLKRIEVEQREPKSDEDILKSIQDFAKP